MAVTVAGIVQGRLARYGLDPGEGGSGSDEPQRHHTDAVRPPVRLWPGRDDDCIEKTVTEPVGEPPQVSRVVIRDGAGQLDLDCDDPSVVADEHQVHLVVPVPRPQMTHGCLGGLLSGLWIGVFVGLGGSIDDNGSIWYIS